MEKTINACIKLRESLMKTKREKIKRITFAIAFCFVAGIVMSKFLIVGFTVWMFVGFFLVWALVMVYSGREAHLNQNIEKLGCEK